MLLLMPKILDIIWISFEIFPTLFLILQGEYGAGTTVPSWKDPLEKDKTFNGFPYVAWTSGMDEPVCLCQEIITW